MSTTTSTITLDGSGRNEGRTPYAAQPRALRVGDRLATGELVSVPPQEGGNGLVLVTLLAGNVSHQVGLPARIPVALSFDPGLTSLVLPSGQTLAKMQSDATGGIFVRADEERNVNVDDAIDALVDVFAELVAGQSTVSERIDLDDLGVDDVAISLGSGMVRLERMDDGDFWMAVHMPDGRSHRFDITSPALISVGHEEEPA